MHAGFQAILAIAVGLVILTGVVREVTAWLRMRRRLRRTTAVVVGTQQWGAADPGVTARSGVFEFVTDRGERVRASSSFYAGRGPRVGRTLGIVYDPENPWGYAERTGVHGAKLALAPALTVLGVFILTEGVRYLL
ncbi:hypothetical protein HLB23_33950 [Nocardia uniformis]|uniref:DUF3592 domain-containing protein n=1 Tax=Nocardia uniformis TaxID=53432 RepID=A0A849CAQ6_9NOCA|nr:DUF3592 domain-containing protein [Nocardia uniformis]NNH74798.1 hypothetical protein [Nocardia uniformis]